MFETPRRRIFLTSITSILVVFLFGAAGEICGSFFETSTGAFESRYPDNRPANLTPVLAQLSRVPSAFDADNALKKPIAVFATDDNPRKLILWDLTTHGILWEKSISLNSTASLGPSILIVQSGYQIIALDLKTGNKRWELPLDDGWNYYGASIDENTAVLALGVGKPTGGGYTNGRVMALNVKDGQIRWVHFSGAGLLGRPALAGGYAFVPWNNNRIAVLGADAGKEVFRLRADDYTIDSVTAWAQGVYFGSNATEDVIASLFRLDLDATSGSRADSTRLLPALPKVPGNPAFERSAFQTGPEALATVDRITFHWQPATNATTARAEQDTFYLHYFGYVIAFNVQDNTPQWIFKSAGDITEIQVTEAGLLAVTEKGIFEFIDARTGTLRWTRDTGIPVRHASFDIRGFAPKELETTAPTDPPSQLKSLMLDTDQRMLPLKIFAAQLLGQSRAPEATGDLLQIYGSPDIPKGLRAAVVEALRTRTTGAEYLRDAISMRYDYLAGLQSPPMGVISPALVKMNDQSSVIQLLAHLENHETAIEDILPIAHAIRVLGDKTAVPVLVHFLALYRADASFIGHEAALVEVAECIFQFGDETERMQMTLIQQDPQTLPALRDGLLGILDPEATEEARAAAAKKKKAEEDAVAAQKAEAAKAAIMTEEANRPFYLTVDLIDNTMRRGSRHLRPCIKDALTRRAGLSTVRMTFSVEGATGKAQDLRILPADIAGLETCLARELTNIQFPLFKKGRQTANYTIRISSKKTPVSAHVRKEADQSSSDESNSEVVKPAEGQAAE